MERSSYVTKDKSWIHTSDVVSTWYACFPTEAQGRPQEVWICGLFFIKPQRGLGGTQLLGNDRKQRFGGEDGVWGGAGWIIGEEERYRAPTVHQTLPRYGQLSEIYTTMLKVANDHAIILTNHDLLCMFWRRACLFWLLSTINPEVTTLFSNHWVKESVVGLV